MIIIVCALDLEAAPLIKELKLKKNHRIHTHSVFENQEFKLIVSGVGKIKAAIAATRLLSHAEDSRLIQAPQLINFGFAASAKHVIGSAFIVKQIQNSLNHKNYYPELFLKCQLPEASLLSSDNFCNNSNELGNFELLDLEAAGIFEAASSFIPISNLHFIKIVSDNCSDAFLSKTYAEELFSNNRPGIIDYLEKLRIHQENDFLLSYEQFQKLRSKADLMQLSQTQFAELEAALHYYLLKGFELTEFIRAFNFETTSKQQRNLQFKELLSFCRSHNE